MTIINFYITQYIINNHYYKLLTVLIFFNISLSLSVNNESIKSVFFYIHIIYYVICTIRTLS